MSRLDPTCGQRFNSVLTASSNGKGVLDVDTVKGCSMGCRNHGVNGCYGRCYAAEFAKARGFDFSYSVSRQPLDCNEQQIENTVREHPAKWFRIGVMGDPSHDWPLTAYVCEWLGRLKTPVIVTKHWFPCPSRILGILARIGVVFNTSSSALDNELECDNRLGEYYRVARAGCKSFLRLVTAKFGSTDGGRYFAERQKWLLIHGKIIDTPLRIPKSDQRVKDGTILLTDTTDKPMSKWNETIYTGQCANCPDQCGVGL